MEERTEDQILNDVKDQLVWDTQVASTDVEVSVEGSEVMLEGTVPSFSALRAAEADAWAVMGVTDVTNMLEVEYPETITLPSDEEIESNIENILLWNASIDSSGVEVKVEAGITELEGTVSSYWHKLRAEELAEDVLGVLEVVNLLAVVPTDSFVDEDIATDVVSALKRKAAVRAEDVNVKVVNGEVTLSGMVPDFTAWSEAYDSARYTAGVVDVVDQLTITYEQ